MSFQKQLAMRFTDEMARAEDGSRVKDGPFEMEVFDLNWAFNEIIAQAVKMCACKAKHYCVRYSIVDRNPIDIEAEILKLLD